MDYSFEFLADRHAPAAVAEGRIAPVKMWTRGVPVASKRREGAATDLALLQRAVRCRWSA